MQQFVRVRRQMSAKKKHDIQPQSKHTTRTTAARRPRQRRSGVPKNKSHAFARACPFLQVPQLCSRPRTAHATHEIAKLHRQTDKSIFLLFIGMGACTHPGMKSCFPTGKKTASSLVEMMRQRRLIVAAGCVPSKKTQAKTKRGNPAELKTQGQNHSSPMTAVIWRWHATSQAACVSPGSPAAIDCGFVEIGLVQPLAIIFFAKKRRQCKTGRK